MGQSCCPCFKADGGVYEPSSTPPRPNGIAGDHSPPVVPTDGDENGQRDEGKRKKKRYKRRRKGRRAAGQEETDKAKETDAVPTYPNNDDEILVQPVTSEAEVLTAAEVHQTAAEAVIEPGVLPTLDGSMSRSNDDRFQTLELPLSDLTSNVPQPLVYPGSDCFQTPQLSLADLAANIPQPLVCSGSDSSDDFFQTTQLSLPDLVANIPRPPVCLESDCYDDCFKTPERSFSDLPINVPQLPVCSGYESSDDIVLQPPVSQGSGSSDDQPPVWFMTEHSGSPTVRTEDEILVQPVTSEAEVLTAAEVHQTAAEAVIEPGVLPTLDGSVSRSNDDRFQTLELPLSDLTSNVPQPLVYPGSDCFQTPQLSLADLAANIPQPLVCSGSDSSDDFFQTPQLSLADLAANIPQPLVCSGSDSSDDIFQTPQLSLADLAANIPQPLVCSGSDSSDDFFQTPQLSLADLAANIPQPLVCSGSDSSDDIFQTPQLSLADLAANIPQPLVCSGSDSSDDIFQTPQLSLADLAANIPQPLVCSGSDSSDDFFQTTQLSLPDLVANIPRPPVCLESDCYDDCFKTPERSFSDLPINVPQLPVCSGYESSDDIVLQPPVSQGSGSSDDQPPVWFMTEHSGSPTVRTEEINSHQYEIGDLLGKGGFGVVYEGTRLKDGLKVAVKYVRMTVEDNIKIPGHPEPLPREVAFQVLVNKGDKVPEIIQLLDWQIHPDSYIMVMERFCPCENMLEYVMRNGGSIDETVVQIVMMQTITASDMCYRRGVFHRDIKLENLLINPDTFDVKLADFGCADQFKSSDYWTFMGTMSYACPEYTNYGQYKAKPATVYSLGVLLYAMVCGRFPKQRTLKKINQKNWEQNGLSTECCSLIQACLQENPEERIRLEDILKHKWFHLEGFDSLDEEELEDEEKRCFTVEEINSCQYKIGKMLGKGGFGSVYEGTRLSDGLKVAVKFVTKSPDDDFISIPNHPEPLTQELALHILISEGDKVPEIIQLLDWQDHADRYVMVLESFSPCKDVSVFLMEDKLDEDLANVIMYQATRAAFMSCKRGVLHRDIKLQNLLINTDTFEVKLIDFGCGDLLKESAYDTFMGTEDYICPEFYETGEYHGKPATVYSLGVLLFVMVCRNFPVTEDCDRIKKKIWWKDGLSKECCSLIQACLQENPEERIELGQILKHEWFQDPLDQNPVNTLSDSNEDELPLASFNLAEKKDEEKQFEN